MLGRNSCLRLSGNGTLSNMEQYGGTCGHAYSIVRPGMLLALATVQPIRCSSTRRPVTFTFSQEAPARNAADPAAVLAGLAARDIDGDLRSTPADIGADEIP